MALQSSVRSTNFQILLEIRVSISLFTVSFQNIASSDVKASLNFEDFPHC